MAERGIAYERKSGTQMVKLDIVVHTADYRVW